MAQAYVLFNVESGSEDQVLKEVKAVSGVHQAFVTYSVYDLIAKIGAASMTELKELVTSRLRRIDNVRETLTLILVE